MLLLRFLPFIASCVSLVAGQACQTITLRTTVPDDSNDGVAVQSYNYCNGNLLLLAIVANTGYNKTLSVYYTYGENNTTAVLPLSYWIPVGDGTAWELWGTLSPVHIEGITSLLNITYDSVSTNRIYVQTLNLPVSASDRVSPLPVASVQAVPIPAASISVVSVPAAVPVASIPAASVSEAPVPAASVTEALASAVSVPVALSPATSILAASASIASVPAVSIVAMSGSAVPTSAVPGVVAPNTTSSAFAAPPVPKVTPSGLSQDVTKFLSTASGSMLGQAFSRMFQNIGPNIAGAAPGSVVAAQSGPGYAQKVPDYEYSWVRDSAIAMDVVQSLYAASTKTDVKSTYERLLFGYATNRATQQDYPGLLTSLGEPKYYLNQTLFTGAWARPQNDGPALSAITLIHFATEYLANGGDVDTVQQYIYDSTTFPSTAPVQRDLLYVAANWAAPSYDLWEEVSGGQFYTRMVQRRALLLGSAFAARIGDTTTAAALTTALNAMTPSLAQFWSAPQATILYESGQVLGNRTSYLDMAVILAILHGYTDDNVYSPISDEVLSTALRVATSFISLYPINNRTTDSAGRPLGIAVGRYPQDQYNGTASSADSGNPWYLTTAAMAEYMYRISKEFDASGQITVTDMSLPFFKFFTPAAGFVTGQTYYENTRQFRQAINGINGWGDAFIRTIKQYMPSNGALSEQFNKDTGAPQGAADLTWSYAALLTAAFARADVKGSTLYVTNLANQGFVSNDDAGDE